MDLKDPYAKVDPDHPDFWGRDDVSMNASFIQFVGIYSGRIPQSEAEAALGMCWREDVIQKICEGQVKGKRS